MGINKLEKTKSSFGLIQKSENTKSGLNHNIITSFCEDYNGNIWISTDGGGINILDPKSLEFSHLLNNPNNPNSISSNTTLRVFEDIDKNIWIGTYQGGLNYYNPKTKIFKHYKYDPNNEKSISSNSPWGFVQDKNKNLWIATIDGGLNLLKYGSDSFIRYKELFIVNLVPSHIISNALTFLFIDSNDNLWISTETGLDVVDLKTVDFNEDKPKLIFKHFQNYPNQNSISFNRTSHIIEDHEGNIWIATKGGGINKYNTQTGKFKTYTTKDGLPHNIITGILEDENHFLWISSNKGLSKFDPKSEVFINYGLSDGIQSNEFYKTSCLKSSDGMLYFGGVNGFNAFYPENIKSNTEIPNVVLTDFKLFNQTIEIGEEINNHILLPVSISELDNIRLDHSQNFISFGFAALNYTSPEKNQYAYKMEGFDNEFRHVDANNRVATYTNLDPGSYTFKVLASNNERGLEQQRKLYNDNNNSPMVENMVVQNSIKFNSCGHYYSIRFNTL
jgi:ligand-binding sensor domain-containing protein